MIFSSISLLGKQKPLGVYNSAPNYSSLEFAPLALVNKLFFGEGFSGKKAVARLFEFVFEVVCI